MRKLFKNVSFLILIIMLVGALTGCQSKGKFNPGTYEGTAEGLGGTITARVTVTKDEITKIEIDAPKETESIGAGAKEQVIERVLESQSLAIDAISGATVSSSAMIAAITAALEKSGADMKALQTPTNQPKEEAQKDLDVDVVVVGAGGAGMSAAIEVANAGKSVVIVEKMPLVGGNTNRATGGINAAETPIQEAAGIKDTKQTFYDDTMKGGKDLNDPELLRTMVDNAPGAIEWLNGMGAGIERVTLSGGATNPRIHTPQDGSPIGPVIVKVLSEKLKELNVDIMLETKAEKIIEKDGVVVGIEATDKNGNPFKINAKAVILATGGFGANSEMVETYRPDLKGFSTTNHQGATGDGIVMAQEVGADLTDIGEIQIHPTTDPGTGYLFTEGLRGDGAILVNFEGKRFTDELLTRDKVSAKILEQTQGQAYLIANEEMRTENKSLAGYIEKGYAVKGESIAELARSLKIDEATLENTMKAYTQMAKAGVDTEFGRKHMTKTLEAGPYYAIKVTPGIHHTMGGVKIDKQAHIISTEGTPIKGLYAAGEITGGVHGGNRIGGNAVADIVVFGRISGQTAVAELQ